MVVHGAHARGVASLIVFALSYTAVLTSIADAAPQNAPIERKAVLDALRPSAERTWKAPVVFRVKEIKVSDGFAYVSVVPTRPNGTVIQMMLAGGRGNAYGDAFLSHARGKWQVLAFRAGAADTWECEYPGIPRQILPSYC